MADDKDDPLEQLAQEVREATRQPKITRANRTLALAEPNYSTLRRYCAGKGLKMQDVVDRLIAAFLLKVQDDLPPDVSPARED